MAESKTVRDTSIRTYDEVIEEGFQNTWQETTYNAIREVPLMTAREYFELVIEGGKREQIFPRITELKKQGKVFEVAKRKCRVSDRLCYVLATLEGVEEYILKGLGFREIKKNLLIYDDGERVLYQDFRYGKRRSYAFWSGSNGVAANYQDMSVHMKFKSRLNETLGGLEEWYQ